jgi:hypothetical protein
MSERSKAGRSPAAAKIRKFELRDQWIAEDRAGDG